MVKLPIYLDNNATTPVDPRVLEAMLPYFKEDFGNAASRNHSFGWKAEEAVSIAREQVAKLVGASSPKEIVFTSGATESDDLAIKGAAYFYREKGNHLITLKTEHKAVLDSCKRLEREGFEVTYLDVKKDGMVDLEVLKQALRKNATYDVKPGDTWHRIAKQFHVTAETLAQVNGSSDPFETNPTPGNRLTVPCGTILVSIMLANNEIGTVQPMAEIGKLCRENGVLLHCDAVQGLGKVPFNVESMKIDLASVSGHKIYGPKGVGALYVRRKPRVRLVPLIDGGGHENGMRSGTLNVPAIVGLGKAAEIALNEMPEESARTLALREKLRKGIMSKLDMCYLNGSLEHRLPGNLNISFAFVEGEALMMALKDVAVSSGSACTSASLEPSYVLRAVGVEEELAHTSIRFGLGRFNTEEEVDFVIDLIDRKVKKLRELSPLYEMAKEGIDLKSITWAAH
jgi:cysteine desulfurase